MSMTNIEKEFNQLNLGEDLEEDFTKKKKKKKKKGQTESDEPNKNNIYKYESLLERIFEEYITKKQGSCSKLKLDELNVARDGVRKTVFINFSKICKQINRDPDHVSLYISTELGTTCSKDSQQRLVIKGRYYPKQIKTILTKYISEYVSCRTCHSYNTYIYKDQNTRLNFIKCNSCSASVSVGTVKSGYKAVMRGDRKK